MSDIAERLRRLASLYGDQVSKEAADEIERLREALTRIREHCADNDAENWIWRTAQQAITAAE